MQQQAQQFKKEVKSWVKLNIDDHDDITGLNIGKYCKEQREDAVKKSEPKFFQTAISIQSSAHNTLTDPEEEETFSSASDISLIEKDADKFRETDLDFKEDGKKRIGDMHERLVKAEQKRLKKESIERAKQVDIMEGLKVDLSDETVRLLLARRKRIQNPFTDHIVKETDRLKEEARKNEEKGIKSPKKEK